ncbi:MAG TPA: cytidine deaminase [Planctomycetota bacterium]|nr:cytidine deaminase [Planctomycetota bacterium]
MAESRPPSPSNDTIQDLLRVAFAAAELAHSPYSKVKVGAALVAADGQVFAGCNIENASYGLTLCAERVAMVKAISSGASRFTSLAVASSLDAPMMPCGACRQFLSEFAPELFVVVQGKSGPRFQARLSELLPHPFGPRDLH